MSATIVIGSSGFLGSVFLKDYPEIISVGRTRPTGIVNRHILVPSMDHLSLLDNVEIDNVIFLIGNSNHHEINNNPMMGIEYNVLPLKKAMDYFSRRKIKKMIVFTTILLYGNEPKNRPVHEQDPIYPYQNEYIFSKYLSEQVVEYYRSSVPCIIVRLSNIYGATSLIRPDLVPTLIHDCLTKENPSVWSDKPQRDFIYASDACEAIMRLLKTDFIGIVNIGSGTMSSVADIIETIEHLSGRHINVLGYQVSGVMKFVTDITLLQSLTGWKPKHSLYQGIQKTFELMKHELATTNNI
jgi:nucleoside-diphosphate-sugar epimerase